MNRPIGYLQQHMLDFCKRYPGRHTIASDAQTIKVARSLESRGLLHITDCALDTFALLEASGSAVNVVELSATGSHSGSDPFGSSSSLFKLDKAESLADQVNEEEALTNSQFGKWIKMTKKCILYTPADKLTNNVK